MTNPTPALAALIERLENRVWLVNMNSGCRSCEEHLPLLQRFMGEALEAAAALRELSERVEAGKHYKKMYYALLGGTRGGALEQAEADLADLQAKARVAIDYLSEAAVLVGAHYPYHSVGGRVAERYRATRDALAAVLPKESEHD